MATLQETRNKRTGPYRDGLGKNLANYASLSPLSFLPKAAAIYPDRVAIVHGAWRSTWADTYARCTRLASALAKHGVGAGDTVAVMAPNVPAMYEAHFGVPMTGAVLNTLNIRLDAEAIAFQLTHGEASVLITDREFSAVVKRALGMLERRPLVIDIDDPLHEGGTLLGEMDYEAFLRQGDADFGWFLPEDEFGPIALNYTSGTTGNPKGVLRNNRSGALLSMVTEIELGVHRNDGALLVMPMCHANSLNFYGTFAYCGGTTSIYSRKNFDPEHCVRTLAEGGSSFTSLVPTHYIMMLGLPAAVRERYELGRVTKLMISSAPARQETKRAVMEMFRNSGLYELYGATEVGWATMLHPHEQETKLGSVGRECVGSAPIRLLDESGAEVADGEAGELYCCTPYTFDKYWNLPDKTAAAFNGAHCSVGDMARRDSEGYIHLVDRKSNMIISGGENIYPSEVEAVIGAHASVKDVAVVGLPDEKWGESVYAAVVVHADATVSEAELSVWCKERLAGFKRPRGFSFLAEDEMPRNATGKILHRALKAKLQG
jgi:acyl-CoA synthetase (AMP-forming)/AMP-acid ligase II